MSTYKNLNKFSLSTELSGIHDVKLYTYKELKMATEDFDLANKIGEGGFGSVYKVTANLFSILLVLSVIVYGLVVERLFLTLIDCCSGKPGTT